MQIVIGVDESPHAQAAVDFVHRMPWPRPIHVIVVTVVPSIVLAYADAYVPTVVSPEVDEALVRRHQELAAAAESVLQGNGVTAEARVVHGDPRFALVEAAESAGADLLVVGSHGRTGIARLIMGSVASHVVTHAHCNVLVVKLERR